MDPLLTAGQVQIGAGSVLSKLVSACPWPPERDVSAKPQAERNYQQSQGAIPKKRACTSRSRRSKAENQKERQDCCAESGAGSSGPIKTRRVLVAFALDTNELNREGISEYVEYVVLIYHYHPLQLARQKIILSG